MEQKIIIEDFLKELLRTLPQGHPLVTLSHAVEQGRSLSHAILFSGERLAGQMLWAQFFAFQLIKKTYPQAIHSSSSPDFHEYLDTGEKFSVEEAKHMRDALMNSPFGTMHVVVFARMERLMSHNAEHEAANTLLKILEEPPTKTQYLFTTDASHSILPTLLSRVQQFVCPPVPFDLANSFLGISHTHWLEAKGKMGLLVLLAEPIFVQEWEAMKEAVHLLLYKKELISQKVRQWAPLFTINASDPKKLKVDPCYDEQAGFFKIDLFFYHFELALEEAVKRGTMDQETCIYYHRCLRAYRDDREGNMHKKLALYNFFISLFHDAKY